MGLKFSKDERTSHDDLNSLVDYNDYFFSFKALFGVGSSHTFKDVIIDGFSITNSNNNISISPGAVYNIEHSLIFSYNGGNVLFDPLANKFDICLHINKDVIQQTREFIDKGINKKYTKETDKIISYSLNSIIENMSTYGNLKEIIKIGEIKVDSNNVITEIKPVTYKHLGITSSHKVSNEWTTFDTRTVLSKLYLDEKTALDKAIYDTFLGTISFRLIDDISYYNNLPNRLFTLVPFDGRTLEISDYPDIINKLVNAKSPYITVEGDPNNPTYRTLNLENTYFRASGAHHPGDILQDAGRKVTGEFTVVDHTNIRNFNIFSYIKGAFYGYLNSTDAGSNGLDLSTILNPNLSIDDIYRTILLDSSRSWGADHTADEFRPYTAVFKVCIFCDK